MTQRGVKCFKLNTHLIEAIIFKTVLDRFRPRRIRLRNKNCQQILWHGLFKESTPGSEVVVWPQSIVIILWYQCSYKELTSGSVVIVWPQSLVIILRYWCCYKESTPGSEVVVWPQSLVIILWYWFCYKESTPGSVAVVWPQSLLWRESQGWQDKILRSEQVTDTARLVQSLIYHTFKLSKDLQILKIFTDSEIVYFVNFVSSCVQFWCKNLTKSCKISCFYIKFHEDNFISEI